MEGSSFPLWLIMSELDGILAQVGEWCETLYIARVLQLFEACVAEQKECLVYRVDETEQGELGIELRALRIKYNSESDFLLCY